MILTDIRCPNPGFRQKRTDLFCKIGENPGLAIYNLGTGKGYSVLDIVKNFEAATGVKIPYVIKPRRAGDIATCYCDASKAEKELGWNLLTYPIHDSLHEYVKALHKLYLEQPALYKSDYNSTSFRWIDADNKNQCIYAYRRSDPSGKTLYMVFNFSGSYQNYSLKVEQNGAYKELLNSDRDIYSGSNCINSGLYTTNYKLPLRLAPLSSVIITTE